MTLLQVVLTTLSRQLSEHAGQLLRKLRDERSSAYSSFRPVLPTLIAAAAQRAGIRFLASFAATIRLRHPCGPMPAPPMNS